MTIGHRSIATHLVMAQQAITGGTATVLSFSGCAMPKSQGLAMFGCASGFFLGVCLVHVLCLTLGDSARFHSFQLRRLHPLQILRHFSWVVRSSCFWSGFCFFCLFVHQKGYDKVEIPGVVVFILGCFAGVDGASLFFFCSRLSEAPSVPVPKSVEHLP